MKVMGELLSNCCKADFDALGFERSDETWQEKCLKCGKPCEPVWIQSEEQPKHEILIEIIKNEYKTAKIMNKHYFQRDGKGNPFYIGQVIALKRLIDLVER